jgi:hypothetical protein
MSKRRTSRPNSTRGTPQSSAEPQSVHYRRLISRRLWMLFNYLTIPLTSVLIFGFTALCEYGLGRFVWTLLAEDIRQSAAVSQIAEWAQIGIAIMAIVGMIVHSGFSLYGMILVERQFTEEGDWKVGR